MTIATGTLLDAAKRLHGHILKKHWNGQAVVGPDPGIRFNARIGRFIKSYLNFIPWSDNLTYMQAQSYWIHDNWLMADITDDQSYRDIAVACSKNLIAAQRSGGYWDYPNPEWKGRIATVEGCFACLALLESCSRILYKPFLEGAKKWYEYMVGRIGFRAQLSDGMVAVNYFAHNTGDGGGVPNNSTLALWTMAKLYEVTRKARFLEYAAFMVSWLKHVQLPSGELPYQLGSPKQKDRYHFLCFQYNAFEFMDLVQYFRITGDKTVWPVMKGLSKYLSTGLNDSGAARFDCFHETPEVAYYTVAIAQALSQATALGIGDFAAIVERGYRRILSQQKIDGNFKFYSQVNYGCLSDRRSYPRYLSMILNHLLKEFQTRTSNL